MFKFVSVFPEKSSFSFIIIRFGVLSEF